jgi:hypothetical protein
VLPDDGSASWLLKSICSLRAKIRKQKTPSVQSVNDLNQYEALVQRIRPMYDWSQSEGYQQWRSDVLNRLDKDLMAWPEQFLGWVKAGHSETQLALAAAVFASTQVMGRRQFVVVDSAEQEKARYDRYQEKLKVQEGTVTQ